MVLTSFKYHRFQILHSIFRLNIHCNRLEYQARMLLCIIFWQINTDVPMHVRAIIQRRLLFEVHTHTLRIDIRSFQKNSVIHTRRECNVIVQQRSFHFNNLHLPLIGNHKCTIYGNICFKVTIIIGRNNIVTFNINDTTQFITFLTIKVSLRPCIFLIIENVHWNRKRFLTLSLTIKGPHCLRNITRDMNNLGAYTFRPHQKAKQEKKNICNLSFHLSTILFYHNV